MRTGVARDHGCVREYAGVPAAPDAGVRSRAYCTVTMLCGAHAGMCDGADPAPTVVLKIGFLNARVEENLPRFKEHFDLILTGDASMAPLLPVIEALVEGV